MTNHDLLPSPSRRMTRALRTARRGLQWVADYVFGFDFFISYAHKDGTTYPKNLQEALAKRAYRACLDQDNYQAGQDINELTRRYVRNSNTLVLLAGPHAVNSRWVVREVEESLDAGRTVIPVDFDRTLAATDDRAELKLLLGERKRFDEVIGPEHTPSPELLNALDGSFVGVRQETSRRRAIAGVAATLAGLSAVAVWQWREAVHQRDEATARLVSQRVANGTRAALDGDLWGGWSWFANALSVAHRGGLNEHAHRERLASLRHLLPHLLQFWLEERTVRATVLAPDSTHVALYDEGDGSNGAIEIQVLATRKRVTRIALGRESVDQLRFSPDGLHLWTLSSSSGDSGAAPGTTASVRSATDGRLVASKTLPVAYGRGRWLGERIISVLSDSVAHIVRFDGETIDVRTCTLSGDVFVAAVSPDGQTIAGYSFGTNQLSIRSSDSPSLQTLSFERSPDVLITADGRHLVTVDRGRGLQFWRLGNSSPQLVAEAALSGTIEELQLDPLGRVLVIERRAEDRLHSQLWDAARGALVRTFDHDKVTARWEFPSDARGGAAAGTAMGGSRVNPFKRRAIVTHDGSRIVTVSEKSRSYRVWDVDTGDSLTPPLSHGGERLLSVDVSRDARALVSTAADGTIRAWDVALPRHLIAPFGVARTVAFLGFTPEGDRLLALSDGKVRVLDWRNRTEAGVIGTDVSAAELADEGRVLVVRRTDAARCFDVTTGAPLSDWLEHRRVDGAVVSRSRDVVVTWNRLDLTLRIWNVAAGTLHEPKFASSTWLDAIAFDPRVATVAFAVSRDSGGRELYTVEADGSEPRSLATIPASEFKGLLYSQSAGLLMFDGRRFWKVAQRPFRSGTPYSTVASELTELLHVDRRGARVILTDRDHQIAQVVDVASGVPTTPTFWHEWRITASHVSRDGSRLLTVSGNGVHVWDLATGEPIVPVMRYPDTITAAALHPASTVFAISTKATVGDNPVAVFLSPLRPETASAEALVAYGEANSGFHIDEVGGRVPAEAQRMARVWDHLLPLAPPIIHVPIAAEDWYKQLLSESGRYIERNRYYLERILELAPDDVDARAKRAGLHLITGDRSSFLSEVTRLSQAKELERVALSPMSARQWARALVQGGRANDAYVVLSHQSGEQDVDSPEWLLALVSAAAERFDALRSHRAALIEEAERVDASDQRPEVKWNAAQYAARACLLDDAAPDALGRMVELAAKWGGKGTADTLQLLRAAGALRRGQMDAVEALLADRLDRYPLARTLNIELLWRRGRAADAAAELTKFRQELAQGEPELDWVRMEANALIARLERLMK